MKTSVEQQQGGRPPGRFEHPVCELVDRLRSAARTGRRLHLEPVHVQLLLQPEIYTVITSMEAEEIREACRSATANDNDTKSATSGSGSGRTQAPGQYAGSTIIPMDAASRGARQLLSEEVAMLRRRKKH